MKRHAPKRLKIFKTFNKNTVKLSYSSCRSISSKIFSNNRRIINPPPTSYASNCRNKCDCPLDNTCLTTSIIYKATISTTSRTIKKNFGISEFSFKDRYRNHTPDFRHKEHVINCLNISGN